MGIFKIENMMKGGIDYAAALNKIETKINENNAKRAAEEAGQIDSSSHKISDSKQIEDKKDKQDMPNFDDNEELYN